LDLKPRFLALSLKSNALRWNLRLVAWYVISSTVIYTFSAEDNNHFIVVHKPINETCWQADISTRLTLTIKLPLQSVTLGLGVCLEAQNVWPWPWSSRSWLWPWPCSSRPWHCYAQFWPGTLWPCEHHCKNKTKPEPAGPSTPLRTAHICVCLSWKQKIKLTNSPKQTRTENLLLLLGHSNIWNKTEIELK